MAVPPPVNVINTPATPIAVPDLVTLPESWIVVPPLPAKLAIIVRACAIGTESVAPDTTHPFVFPDQLTALLSKPGTAVSRTVLPATCHPLVGVTLPLPLVPTASQ